MVYGRRRSGRKNRRSSRTLSTRRIFNNKGARAQASQINALKKRINRVYRRTKPEYKLLRPTPTDNRTFGPDEINGPSALINGAIFRLATPALGTGDNERIGNKITMAPTQFFLNVRYTHVNTIIDNIYPYIQHPLTSNGMMLRFVAVQAISAGSYGPSFSDLFAADFTAEGTNSQDVMMMMTMPFKNGITTRFKILKDKRITLSEDNPTYAARFKIKPRIKSLRWEDGQSYPAGQIFVVMIGAGGDYKTVRDDNEVDRYNYNFLDTTWRYELPYTDV